MQQEKLKQYAALHDYEIVGLFVDNGESAKSLDRPALKGALALLPEADGLVIYKLDRLTRSVRDLHTLLDEYFRENQCRLCSVCDQLDTGTPTGRLMLNLMVSVSEWERETIGCRTKEGLQHKKSKGEVYCGRLYGYDKVDGVLVENDNEQSVIQKIVNLRSGRGYSFSATADHLNANGYIPPKGKLWYHATVKQIFNRFIEKPDPT